MNDAIDLTRLFDADEYRRSGNCPWTFFAYPTVLADDNGLPPDPEACKLLGAIQNHGIEVAVWVNGIDSRTTFFACRKDDVEKLNDYLQVLEAKGAIDDSFCAKRSERLFALLGQR